MNTNLPHSTIPNGYMTLTAAATMLGVCHQTLRYQIRKGTIPAHRFGRNTAIKVSDISTLAANIRLGGRKPTRQEAIAARETTIQMRKERVELALSLNADDGDGVFNLAGFQKDLADILDRDDSRAPNQPTS